MQWAEAIRELWLYKVLADISFAQWLVSLLPSGMLFVVVTKAARSRGLLSHHLRNLTREHMRPVYVSFWPSLPVFKRVYERVS